MLKVELHAHTSDDPVDRIPYTAHELIDRAVVLGYDALAITLHERQDDAASLRAYAAERNLVLIPGVERTIEGCHVLLLNFPAHAVAIDTFDELARLRRHHHGLVVAPHAFFPAPSCLRGRLYRHERLFDAAEFHAMYTRTLNFNTEAERWSARTGKPLVGNCDVHVLRQLGTTCSLVQAERHPEAICEAIVEGRVRVQTRPLAWSEAAGILIDMALPFRGNRHTLAPRLDPARSGML